MVRAARPLRLSRVEHSPADRGSIARASVNMLPKTPRCDLVAASARHPTRGALGVDGPWAVDVLQQAACEAQAVITLQRLPAATAPNVGSVASWQAHALAEVVVLMWLWVLLWAKRHK